MKSGEEAVVVVVDLLNEMGIAYMLVGSFSSNYYGVPRATKDADFVVEMGPVDRAAFFKRLPKGFAIDPQVRFETITGTRRQIVEIPTIPFTIEFFDLAEDPFAVEQFARRVRVLEKGKACWLPTAEDVVLQKLRWYASSPKTRAQDYEDARDVISVQGEGSLDWDYIHGWCAVHGTRELLDDIRASIPPLD